MESKKHPVMHTRIYAAALFAAVFSSSPSRADFTFDDIHYWVGEGTNCAALVIDFSRDGYAPLVWGFRWNGDATAADALLAIVHDDNRLHALADNGKYGLSLYALGYDCSDVAAAFHFDYNRGDIVAQASDANAFVAGGWLSVGFWAQWVCPVGDALDTSFFESSPYANGGGLTYTVLANDSWHVLQFERNFAVCPLSAPPLPAESPYAWRVVDADVARGGDYGDPANALGHPSLSVPAWGEIPPTTVNPASPAWGSDQLVSLVSAQDDDDACGWITIEFDHNVIDDPRNPFGLDFIVFGNAMQTIGGNAWFDGVSDPADVSFATDALISEPGLVEVSADGTNWFAFANGPYADDFAPTLSHLYDPAHADTNLFSGNLWWSAPADATRPVDPEVTATDFKGRTLAEYATLYDGSAGGTGFDISAFELPTDEQGRKFIRFVRITTMEPGNDTEIDAVADVSPAPSFRNWVDEYVAFEDRPGYATTNICANGAPAFVNAAFGVAPNAPAPGAWAIDDFDGATRTLTAPFAPFASDLVSLRSSTNLTGVAWSASLPLWTGTNTLGRPLLRAQTPAGAAEFFRLEVHE